MRKITISLISILLMLTLTLPVFAAQGSLNGSAPSSAYRGDTITVSYSLNNCDPFKSMSIMLSYNKDVFELVSGAWSLEDAVLKSVDVTKGVAVAAYQSAVTKQGTIVSFVFKIKDNAAFGSSTISASPTVKNNPDEVPVSGCSVTVNVLCNHSYGNWSQTSAPTCTVDGQQQRSCSVCGNVETKKIDALGHTMGNWSQTKAPTCTAAGEDTRTCTANCGYKETRPVKALEHTMGNWSQTKAPTCTAEGEDTRSCTANCGYKETRPVAVLGHTMGQWTQTTAPTCTEEGEETLSCTANCGYKETRPVAALGHTMGEWVLTTAPSCTEEGEETLSCTANCGHTETRPVEALGHTMGQWTQKVAPTCTEAGEEIRGCTAEFCEYTETRVAEAKGHSFSGWKTTTEATCTEKGAQERTCSACELVETKEVELAAHSFQEPVIVKEATLSTAGLMQGKCENCSETTEQIIPCNAKDSKTGIVVEAQEGVFGAGTSTDFAVIAEDGQEYAALQQAMSEISGGFRAYRIGFVKDNSNTVPNGEYKLTIPVSQSILDQNLTVCFIDDQGIASELEYVFNADGTVSVTTDKTGIFVLADRSVPGISLEPEATEPEETEPEATNPEATDAPTEKNTEPTERPVVQDEVPVEEDNTILLIILLLLIIIGVVSYIFYRRGR